MKHDEPLKQLLTLFTLEKKRQIEAHCRTLVIRSEDFAEVILAGRARMLGLYAYRCHFRELRPAHLEPTPDELDALAGNGTGELQGKALKMMRKVGQLFDDRRLLAAHLFYSPSHQYWHLFYFDQRDRAERDNHWEHGQHIHYVHDTFTREPLAEVWRKVCQDKPAFPRGLHIRYDYHHNRSGHDGSQDGRRSRP